MGKSYALLLVEDEQGEIDRFSDAIKDFNEADPDNPKFELLIAKNQEDANQLISTRRIDCGVIDLIIPRTGAHQSPAKESRGEELVVAMIKSLPAPFVIHSARSEDFDRSKISGIPVEIIDKGLHAPEKILDWLKQHVPLMDTLSETLEQLKRESALIFFRNVWPNWLGRKEEDVETFKAVAARQISAHLGEVLSFDVGSSQYHFDEVYFAPPVRAERLFTGDIFVMDRKTYIIVTRPCDMAREEYPKFFLLAECGNVPDWAHLANKSGPKKKECIEKYTRQNIEPSKHFLPPCGQRGPWLVDFRRVSSISSAEADKILDGRIASISPRFLPNLLQRVFSWLSGVGQPDLDVEALLKVLPKPA